MSGGKKATTISHRALDEIIKFKTAVATDVGQFKIDVIKAVKEIADRHNDLAAHLAALEGIVNNTAAFAASEIGKLGGMSQRHFNELDKSVNAIDLNVLALAELSKEVIGQLSQVDVLINRLHSTIKTLLCGKYSGLMDEGLDPPGSVRRILPSDIEAFRDALRLAESDVESIKANAEKWYGDLVASAFKIVRTRLDAEDEIRREKEAVAAQEAKEAVEKAAADEAETKAVEAEIQKANSDDLAVAATTSGGSGSPFPVGAEIFGS